MSRFTLVVFDLDGTLIDSRRDIVEAVNATLVTCGATALPEDALGRMVGDGAPVLVARAFAAAGAEKPADALARFLSIYHAGLLRHTRPYAGIPLVLEQLTAQSTTLAVLTNKPLEATGRILRGLDLWRYFAPDCVVGGDGPFPRKPDPQGLRHLMVAARATAETTVLVGDSIVDWRTARGAAVQVCLATYGFGWEGFPADQLAAGDWVVDNPAEILQRLS
jgi:phosphoglycolate phosphatase